MDQYLLPLITFITGAGGIKLIERWFHLKDKNLTQEADDKKLLWQEIGKLQQKVEHLEKQVDYWQGKYMDLLEKYTKNQAVHEQLVINYNRVCKEVEELKDKVNEQH